MVELQFGTVVIVLSTCHAAINDFVQHEVQNVRLLLDSSCASQMEAFLFLACMYGY
jgi:hypothetical protein